MGASGWAVRRLVISWAGSGQYQPPKESQRNPFSIFKKLNFRKTKALNAPTGGFRADRSARDAPRVLCDLARSTHPSVRHFCNCAFVLDSVRRAGTAHKIL